MSIFVNTTSGNLTFQSLSLPFRWGKTGFVPENYKCEGDGKTPLGTYVLRFGFYRQDKLPNPAKLSRQRCPLTFHAIEPDDGWCDDRNDPLYNRFIHSPINQPFPSSHERLWREDHVYDIIIVLSHNDSPPIAGFGSAIFIHIARIDDTGTEGCIALTPENMLRLLPYLEHGMEIKIVA